MASNTYDFTEHLHRYAVWTAARAAQRGFTTTKNIKQAIDATSLKELIHKPEIAVGDFDGYHRECAKALIKAFKKMKVDASYGRIAKIIAIYIKTAVILPNKAKSELSKIAHPPIDRILLKNVLPKGDKIPNWTELDKKKYFDLIKKIRAKIKAEEMDANWKLEVYWDATE
jgi:hypothetical protein